MSSNATDAAGGGPRKGSGEEPADAPAWIAAAVAHERAGRPEQAERTYEDGLRKWPDDIGMLARASVFASMRGDHATAIRRMEHAAVVAPAVAQVHSRLAGALHAAGRQAEAEVAARRAIDVGPAQAEPWFSLGIVLRQVQRRGEALDAFRRAHELAPQSLAFAAAFAVECNDTGDVAGALAVWRHARHIAPQDPQVGIGMALALRHLGRFDEAIAEIDDVTRRMPESIEAWRVAGEILYGATRHERAEAAYRRILALKPRNQAAWKGVAWALLARGRLREGLDALEHRSFGLHARDRRLRGVPTWDGSDLRGTLVVHADLGFGTMIMDARFLRDVRSRVSRLVLLIDGARAPLASLLTSAAGVDRVVTEASDLGDEQPAACASFGSLPFHAKASPPFRSDTVPYLSPSASRLAKFRAGARAGVPRIGVAWSVASRDALPILPLTKSFPASAVSEWLAARPDVDWHTIQPGEAGDPAPMGVTPSRLRDHRDDLPDFDATAALIATLDLVISPDTAVAHLAGALGRPVWLVYRSGGSWQFGWSGETTPWYPTMRIFRQTRALDWTGPVAAVGEALRAFTPSSAS